MRKAQGLINDGVIEQVSFQPSPVDLSCIPEEHRTRFFNPGELDALAALLRTNHVWRFIEIGCQNGRTAKVLLHNLPIDWYIGIDVPPGTPLSCAVQRTETPERAGELALGDPRFFLILTKDGSKDALHLFYNKHVDAVFIDGDHSYEAVKRDHILAREIVRPGGLIIHHDYHDLGTVGVKQALQELAASGEKFYHVKDTWLVYCIV